MPWSEVTLGALSALFTVTFFLVGLKRALCLLWKATPRSHTLYLFFVEDHMNHSEAVRALAPYLRKHLQLQFVVPTDSGALVDEVRLLGGPEMWIRSQLLDPARAREVIVAFVASPCARLITQSQHGDKKANGDCTTEIRLKETGIATELFRQLMHHLPTVRQTARAVTCLLLDYSGQEADVPYWLADLPCFRVPSETDQLYACLYHTSMSKRRRLCTAIKGEPHSSVRLNYCLSALHEQRKKVTWFFDRVQLVQRQVWQTPSPDTMRGSLPRNHEVDDVPGNSTRGRGSGSLSGGVVMPTGSSTSSIAESTRSERGTDPRQSSRDLFSRLFDDPVVLQLIGDRSGSGSVGLRQISLEDDGLMPLEVEMTQVTLHIGELPPAEKQMVRELVIDPLLLSPVDSSQSHCPYVSLALEGGDGEEVDAMESTNL